MAGAMSSKSRQPITVSSGLFWLLPRIGLPLLLIVNVVLVSSAVAVTDPGNQNAQTK